MAERTITITISENLFLQLEAAARSSAQPMDKVVAQTLEHAIPQHLSTLLPSALRDELDAMEHLSDEALRAIAYSVAPVERGQQIDDLIDLKLAGSLTESQQAQLTALQSESEALMIRKAHAFVLLKNRGHVTPTIDQLPLPQ